MADVAPRLRPLIDRPIGFAHRGARAHAPENTIEAFTLAKRLGASGIESDAWLTADGFAVLDHDGMVGRRLRRQPIHELRRASLPSHIPTLEEYYNEVGTDLPLSLDVKNSSSFGPILSAARNAGGDAEANLWLCHPQFEQLIEWRSQTDARLVDSTRLSRIKGSFEQRVNKLRSLGIDAINMRLPDWSGGLVATAHRFDRFALGWDAQQPREIASLFDIGIDGVYSDHSDRLSEALRQFFDS